MMKFTLEFDCDNAAFEDDPEGEIARILQDVSERIDVTWSGTVIDANGNKVGAWKLAAQ